MNFHICSLNGKWKSRAEFAWKGRSSIYLVSLKKKHITMSTSNYKCKIAITVFTQYSFSLLAHEVFSWKMPIFQHPIYASTSFYKPLSSDSILQERQPESTFVDIYSKYLSYIYIAPLIQENPQTLIKFCFKRPLPSLWMETMLGLKDGSR